MGANKLEQAANAARESLIARNHYNGEANSNNYSSTHTRAMSDDTTPKAGKGTGVFLDTYNGGDDIDVNGNPTQPGSGRIKNIIVNQYNKDNEYGHPDTSSAGIAPIN